ncbi:MAG: heterodisulfide reductase-related iron-sulfur binding cluster [Bacteroidetes bacterium]|nr:heterodisulfide reductase-related iron-sulfur binding cluster [Bacteroidota bacterium]
MIKQGKKNVWKEYQKEIPDDNYYYARSCIRQNFFPASETIFLRIIREVLGKTIYDDEHQTTCTGIAYHSDIVPFDTTMTVAARQFSLMNIASQKNFIISCVTSFGIYSEVMETWKHHPEILEKTREHLRNATGREFSSPEIIAHTSDIIFKYREQIKEKAKFLLVNKSTGKPLRVVEHIGCHYAKIFPEKGIGGAEFPYVLAGMVENWGGEVIDYPERRHCCGFGFRHYIIKENRGYSLSNTKLKFDSMEAYEPDFIITNCPGCTFFLDRWQYVIAEMEEKTYGKDGFGIPVLTYEEVAGLVLGWDPYSLGLQLHQVSVEPLLDKMGINYNENDKYLGNNNEDIGRPAFPFNLKVTKNKQNDD